MSLTPEQMQAVSGWVAAGDNLSAVQKKLSEQFKISMTYMDVRFLVDDLGLELKNAAPKSDATDVTKAAPAGAATPSSRSVAPSPRSSAPAPGTAGEKKGFMDKLKEKVGMGAGPDDEDELPAEDFAEEEEGVPAAPPAGASTLKVEIDRIVRPGSVVSGTVTFSDGVTGKWALDQYGRLMLETGQKGYQPGPADVQAFQRELSTQLQRQGY